VSPKLPQAASRRTSTSVYRVTQPFAATAREDGRFLTVKRGTLLTVDGPFPLEQFGLVEAIWADQILLVYTRDIERCAEPVVLQTPETTG
jgi:hypothetical protein